MAHNHGNEYQLKIVHEDGTEEFGQWIMSREELVQAMVGVPKVPGKAYWLRERKVLCPTCLDEDRIIVECPVTNIPSPRYSPYDSHYLLATGSRDLCELPEVFAKKHKNRGSDL
jgi:hypothetical protein